MNGRYPQALRMLDQAGNCHQEAGNAETDYRAQDDANVGEDFGCAQLFHVARIMVCC
ncbi:hypothetical protein D3C72_2504320 [compost metagenome]